MTWIEIFLTSMLSTTFYIGISNLLASFRKSKEPPPVESPSTPVEVIKGVVDKLRAADADAAIGDPYRIAPLVKTVRVKVRAI